MRIGVIARPRDMAFAGRLKEALEWLQSRGCGTIIEESAAETFGLTGIQAVSREEIPNLADFIVVFGGDGTILSVARLIRDRKAPILGVNLGSLGFLTEVTLEELYSSLAQLLTGRHKIDRRWMLKTEIHRINGEVEAYHALNDAVINKGALARIMGMKTFINEDFIADFLADGMIIATPTGSTAYSLSAGGPIVFPSLDALIMTPICPHTLTNRPLVIPADSKIRVVLQSGEDIMLTMDGQTGVPLQERDEILCTRSAYQVELVRPSGKSFFDVLREKLKWAAR